MQFLSPTLKHSIHTSLYLYISLSIHLHLSPNLRGSHIQFILSPTHTLSCIFTVLYLPTSYSRFLLLQHIHSLSFHIHILIYSPTHCSLFLSLTLTSINTLSPYPSLPLSLSLSLFLECVNTDVSKLWDQELHLFWVMTSPPADTHTREVYSLSRL